MKKEDLKESFIIIVIVCISLFFHIYFDNLKKTSEGQSKTKKETTQQIKLCYKDKPFLSFCDMKNTPLNGTRTTHYKNGNLYGDITYNAGNPTGKTYYENGNLQAEFTIQDGNGYMLVYDEDENVSMKIILKDGNLGKTESYYSNGKLEDEVFYENGIAVFGYKYDMFGNKKEKTKAHLYNVNKNNAKSLNGALLQ